MSKITDTNVSQVEISEEELDKLLSPGADAGNIITAANPKKPNVFSSSKVDMTFINEPDTPEESETPPSISSVKKEVDEITAPPIDQPIIQEDRAKPETIKLFNKLIKDGKIVPFEDDKKMEDYSEKDFEELLEANFQEREHKIRQQTPAQFYESLPEEMQIAAKYIADGGRDMKGLFKVLSENEEVRSLDPANPDDHETIVRNYLRAIGDDDDKGIEEEIESLKDRNELETKANKYKPKLEQMSERIVAQKLAKQEQIQKQQHAASRAYMENIYRTLEPGVLDGIKLDKKTQNMLYAGLVQPNYPSMSGRPTNLLGHLLEKYQYTQEANHGLIVEATWLLADPTGYKNKLREQGKSGAIEKTVRALKTEEASKNTDSPVIEKDEAGQRRIPRNNNFFKR